MTVPDSSWKHVSQADSERSERVPSGCRADGEWTPSESERSERVPRGCRADGERAPSKPSGCRAGAERAGDGGQCCFGMSASTLRSFARILCFCMF